VSKRRLAVLFAVLAVFVSIPCFAESGESHKPSDNIGLSSCDCSAVSKKSCKSTCPVEKLDAKEMKGEVVPFAFVAGGMKGEVVPFAFVAGGGMSEARTPSAEYVRSGIHADAIVKMYRLKKDTFAKVDFEKMSAIIFFAGEKPSGGHGISVIGDGIRLVECKGGKQIYAHAKTSSPSPELSTIQMLTYPWIVVSFSKTTTVGFKAFINGFEVSAFAP